MYTGTRPWVTPAIRAGKGWRGRRELAPRCSATQLDACAVRSYRQRHVRYMKPVPHTPPQHTTTTQQTNTPPQHTTTTHHHNTPPQHTTTTHHHNTPPQHNNTTHHHKTTTQHTTTTTPPPHARQPTVILRVSSSREK